ncbi:AAA family ATPase [Roseivirga spongicola]|uniref:AAA family ATPase n=1 Tax=Roseivirga spongicola TaxID=333140 RepID=UPI002AC922D0|nr:AAA family ATPase [Roseivirga spongicola]WPZ09971.1 AAA family ATPase [Roseivirga spongicola]
MKSKKEVLLYNLSKYKELKVYYSEQEKEIVSISDFIQNESLIAECIGHEYVIDISALTNVNQYHTERIISLLDNSFTFVANIKHQGFFEEELRFCFEKFTVFEEYIEENSDSDRVKQLSTKKHKKVIDIDQDGLDSFFTKVDQSLYGHQKFKDDFKDLIQNFRVFNKLGEHIILSLFLMGDSGVGKTEVARAIHKALGGEAKMAKVNFGNYSSDNSLNSLIGSPRGYIGSEDGEIFIRVADSDTGVILIDEFEKSNSTLFNYFLDVLENGKMVSSLAHEIDLNGFIIIFTSNTSKENFKKVISPELRSRFDYKGYFSILKTEDKRKYVEFRLNSIVRKFNKSNESLLDEPFKQIILSQINVRKFKNMRDLNKSIKQMFVKELNSLDH